MTLEDKAKLLDKFPGMVCRFTYNPPLLPIIFAGGGCEGLVEYTPEELAGLQLMNLVHPEDIDLLEVLHSETLTIGEPLETTFRVLTKSGGEKLVLSRSRVAETDDMGMPRVIEAFVVDITKQMRITGSLAENREDAGLLSEMVHWIRVPMNTILGLAEIGLRGDMPDIVREYTNTIKRAGSELMSVLNNVHDYTQIRSGTFAVRNAEYSLTSLLNDIVNIIRPRIQDAGLEFAVYVDSKLPQSLTGDEALIKKIMLNLLSNAAKFADMGYVYLAVTGDSTTGDIVNLEIKVTDTGRGIKEEEMPTLFAEFTQFDTKNVEGAGLGLLITKEAARLMDGEIDVVSAYGAGSIFTVTVPQRAVESTGGGLVPDFQPEGKSAIVFDRHEMVGESICLALEDLGVEFRQALTAQDFYEALTGGGYAFAFVDSGLYAEYLKKHPVPSAKIVLLTEHDQAENDGCFAVLSRPLYCLPIVDALKDVPVAARSATKLTAPGARVLLVDDIPANLTVAEGLLRPWEMDIDMCESGAGAIEAVKSTDYDLILMDYKMPIMNGIDATIAIRGLGGHNERVPIIALTASVEYYIKELFRQSGFSDILTKPVAVHRLNTIIERWLPAKKLRTQEYKPPAESSAEIKEIKIEGVDTETGISLSGGSFEGYMLFLGKYCENSRRMSQELRACLDNNETGLYGIYVHALKSLSANIGAAELSEYAAALESAVEGDDYDFIYAENENFIKMMEHITDNIEAVLPSGDKPAEPPKMPERRKKVLIIDDTAAFIFLMNEILKNTYDTVIATDGRDGLETASATMPDLIIADIIMPEMSGLEVLDAVKADDNLKSIPVILMSGNKQDNNPDIAQRGAAGYLEKPFKPAEALALIGKVLN